jgi:hypothetical protein
MVNPPIVSGLIPRDFQRGVGSSPVDIHEAKQVVKLLLRERGAHPPVDARNAQVRHNCARGYKKNRCKSNLVRRVQIATECVGHNAAAIVPESVAQLRFVDPAVFVQIILRAHTGEPFTDKPFAGKSF